ncbi:MAG: phytanoyl-CoA dioxygenase family protein [Alphaproteobacteria bacterium]|nr:phytanoyl-CoA dioxygenase family protein [Alphaproteobacteria bacterium]
MGNHLSAAAVAAYRRDGYVHPLPCLTTAEAKRYRDGLEAWERESGEQATLIIRNKGHLKLRMLYDLVHDPRILDAIESVIGPDILCWSSSLFVKEPHDPAFVAWHQDSYYWGLEPDDVVSAWVAFAPSTLANGAMQVIPGSHTAPQFPHRKSAEGSGNMLFTHEEIAVDVDEGQGVSLLLGEGEMSLHHVKIVHGSPPNRSDARRYGYAIRYVAPHVRQRGDMPYATLVRGRDDHGFFKRDPVPTRDFDPAVLALFPNRKPVQHQRPAG